VYSWYKREDSTEQIRLIWEEQTSLAGCNNGVIASELKEALKPADNPPAGWTLPIAEKWNQEDYALIIDIKPKSGEVFLCELDRVFGYSFEDWSPIMLRLKLLYSGLTHEDLDKKSFIYPEDPEIIYTMLYLSGSFRDGKLVGTWNPPFGTITAVLFEAEAMTYFYGQVKNYDPEFLTAAIKVIES
jgi:hypothetical protein